jgi:hypothetical protein
VATKPARTMSDEKHKYEPLPIPSYEEAVGTSSRTSENENEDAHPAEREGLLGSGGRLPVPTRRAGYRPPLTDSARDSGEHDSFLGQNDGRRSSEEEGEEVRREMEETDLLHLPIALLYQLAVQFEFPEVQDTILLAKM